MVDDGRPQTADRGFNLSIDGREVRIVGSIEEMRPEDRENLARYLKEKIPVLEQAGLLEDAERLKSTVKELSHAETAGDAERQNIFERECPFCGGGPVYQDRVDQADNVAHCDDCGEELTLEQYKKVLAAEDAEKLKPL